VNIKKVLCEIDMEQVRERVKQDKLTFASSVSPDKASERRFLLLTESIRAFAGSLSHAPIWCFTLGNERNLSKAAKDRLSALNITFIRFEKDAEIPQFPFVRKVFLNAQAESIARGKTDLLVWLDNDTIVLQEPKGFIL